MMKKIFSVFLTLTLLACTGLAFGEEYPITVNGVTYNSPKNPKDVTVAAVVY